MAARGRLNQFLRCFFTQARRCSMATSDFFLSEYSSLFRNWPMEAACITTSVAPAQTVCDMVLKPHSKRHR
jgi:hypothetical protein